MKKKTNISLLIFISIFSVNTLISQVWARPNVWKKYRREVVVQIGASGFLGDLGGRDQIGKNNSPVDLDFASSRPTFSLGYRYKFTKNINLNTSFNYLLVSGSDKLTNEPFRNNRNLSFRSNIFELSTRIEFSISSLKRQGFYSLKKSLLRFSKPKRGYELIAFIGVGAFYFNPKGPDPTAGSRYIALRPLHTEGQGLPGGPKQYSRFSISIPVGVAFHMILNKYWSWGIEFNYRKTFTDYIDDVSGTYYDKVALEQAYGPKSVLMADPSKGDIPGQTYLGDGTPQQRGNKGKDSYMSFQVSVGRFFPPKRGRTKLRSKF